MEFFNTEFNDSFVSKGNHLKGRRLTPGQCRDAIDDLTHNYGIDCTYLGSSLGQKGYTYCYGKLGH